MYRDPLYLIQMARRAKLCFPAKSAQAKAMRRRWILARARVDTVGTWRFPVGEKHIETAEVAEFLRRMPPGQHLSVEDAPRDKVRKSLRYVRGMLR